MPHDERAAWDEMASEYHSESITPFAHEVEFRFESDLEEVIENWSNREDVRRVVDFGCGPGDSLTPVLTRTNSAHVAGFDFSPLMLERAAMSVRHRGRTVQSTTADDFLSRSAAAAETTPVGLIEGDLRELESFAGRLDLALSINSICPSTPSDAQVIFDGIAQSLRPGGVGIYVVPAFDSTEYLFELAEKYGDELDLGEIDREAGTLVYESGEPQKHLTATELERFCSASEVEIENLSKVEYPWPLMREAGWGDYPSEPPLWDWYLRVRRG
ncbi:MAG: class I SAM-dependent methyltransferase [Planctomycetota bacterium]